MFNWYIHTLCSIGIYIHYFQLVYTYTMFNWYIHTLCSISIYIHYVQLVYTYTMFNLSLLLPCYSYYSDLMVCMLNNCEV